MAYQIFLHSVVIHFFPDLIDEFQDASQKDLIQDFRAWNMGISYEIGPGEIRGL